MAALILPSRRIFAPRQGYALNRAAAAQAGAIYLTFADRELRDAVSGTRLANPGGLSLGPSGQVATFNGAQQAAQLLPLPNGAQNLIIAARIRATAAQAGTPGAAFGIYASTGNQYGVGVGFDPSNNVGAASLTGNGAFLNTRSPGSLNRWYTVYMQAEVAVGGLQVAYIDGKPATIGQNASSGGGEIATPDEIAIGAQHRSAGFLRQFTGQIEWASLLHVPGPTWRTLTDDLATRLYEANYPYNLIDTQRRIWVPVGGAPLPTLVQPASTTTPGAWTATGAATLHQAINEPTPSDAEYISVSSASTSVMELANAAFPGTANQTLAYWGSSALGSSLTVTLRQGATQIMTRTHTLASVNTLYTQTLTAPEIATIVAGPVTVELTASA